MSEINDWVKLDNAGKIYPAARRRNWMMMFRLSATLKEEIDPEVLVLAQERVLKRLPYFAYRLRHGMFWYYMERTDSAPPVEWDVNSHAVGCGGIKSAADSLIHRYGRDAVGDFVIIYRSSDKSAALNGCRY